MAQLRQDYQEFVDRQAVIVVVGPEDRQAFKQYWEKEQLPFIGLADPQHQVADMYGQQVKWLKLGRMPSLMIIDKRGFIRYWHYANAMSDIPRNQELFDILDTLNQQSAT